MPARRSGEERWEGGDLQDAAFPLARHKAGSRGVQQDALEQPWKQTDPSAPFHREAKAAEAETHGRAAGPHQLPRPRRAPQEPWHEGLQQRGPAPNLLPPHNIPFCFLLRLKQLGAGGPRCCSRSPLGSYRRIYNPPAGLVWVGFLLSNSHVFSADFFLRCSSFPAPSL